MSSKTLNTTSTNSHTRVYDVTSAYLPIPVFLGDMIIKLYTTAQTFSFYLWVNNIISSTLHSSVAAHCTGYSLSKQLLKNIPKSALTSRS